jgi:uncharacterized membrane protein
MMSARAALIRLLKKEQTVDSQQSDAARVRKLKLLGIVIGIVIVIPILAWKWGVF